MRASRGRIAVAAGVAIATSIVGIASLAGASTHPLSAARASTKGVIVTTAASPEVVVAGASGTPVSLTVTIYLNAADLVDEQGDCSATFVNALTASVKVGAAAGETNSKGVFTLPIKYEASAVTPGSFCVIYGGILGGKGLALHGKETGKTKEVGVNFAIVICQTNPADDPYTISQSAAHTSVATGGPSDKFTLTVKKDSTPIDDDSTIFYDEDYSTWNSCGLSNPLPPPGSDTNGSGISTIGYEPSTTAGTCKVTAQEADTGSTSNVVKITQTS
jgi:hypothetical protein